MRDEDLTLDPTGNWTDYVQKTSGTTVLDQDRDHNNKLNEIDTDDVHGDADNPITETTGTAWADPVHDAAGNMTGVPKPADLANGLPCTYDAWNRLVEVPVHPVVKFRYEHDGLNRRTVTVRYISGAASNHDHRYHNASWQVVETRVYDSSGQPETAPPWYQYVWSARYIDSPVLRDLNSDQDGLCDDQRLYYLGDANFNVTCLVDTGGDAVERYLYDPYGKVTIYTGDWSSTRSSSSYHNVYLYTGRERDEETRYYNYRNRYYHAELGRFLSRDPIGYRDGPNRYAYTKGGPTSFRDPWGLWSRYEVLKILCCTSIGRDRVSAFNRNYGKVFNAQYIRGYKATRSDANSAWGPWQPRYWGGLSSGRNIYIKGDASNAFAAKAFVHEVEHLQKHTGELHGVDEQGEWFAYLRETLFALESPDVDPRPGFVKENEDGTREVDFDAIRAFVDSAYAAWYQQASLVKYQDDASGIRRVEFGYVLRVFPWTCPPVNPRPSPAQM